MRTGLSRFNLIITFLLLCTFNTPFSDAREIKIGMSSAFSGPAGKLGINMKAGIESYFNKVNDNGGIKGRTLRLITRDDGYEPDNASSNLYNMVTKDSVVAFMGNVGTPTAAAALPIAVEHKVLFFAPYTGASMLRPLQNHSYMVINRNSYLYDKHRYMINYRASYPQEAEVIVKNLLESGINPYEIAFFTQDDSYGDEGYQGAITALRERGVPDPESLPHGRYKRNTVEIERGLLEIVNSLNNVKAVIIVGTYKPAAKFINYASELFPNTVFINLSFVGSMPLAKLLDPTNDRVFITQVVPHFNSDLPGVRQYRSDLEKYFPDLEPDFVSLEGYIAAKLFADGLNNVRGEFNTENIIDGIDSLEYNDFGFGMDITLDEMDHQASDKIWLTRIENNRCIETSWSEFRSFIKNRIR